MQMAVSEPQHIQLGCSATVSGSSSGRHFPARRFKGRPTLGCVHADGCVVEAAHSTRLFSNRFWKFFWSTFSCPTLQRATHFRLCTCRWLCRRSSTFNCHRLFSNRFWKFLRSTFSCLTLQRATHFRLC